MNVPSHGFAESVPAPLVHSSFFSGPLDTRSFVTLEPGMRLTVERSIYRDAGARTAENYVGEAKAVYLVEGESRETLGMKLTSAEHPPSVPRSAANAYFETKLAPQFQKLGGMRVFMLTLYVAPSVTRTALIIGVRDPAAMPEISRTVEKSPNIPCSQLVAAGAVCTAIEGDVSAVVELGIQINGARQYVPLTSTLRSLINALPEPQQASALTTLRMRRLYRGKYYDVQFRHDDPELETMPIFQGDQLNW